MGLRFIRFNVVGALGVGVRLLVAAVLVSGFGLHYLVATAIAIETAILHNFIWHLRWTWAVPDAQGGRQRSPVQNHVGYRCVAFHAGNGLVSMLGSMVLMPMLVGGFHLHYLVANLVAVCCTGVLNFFIGDRVVFRGA